MAEEAEEMEGAEDEEQDQQQNIEDADEDANKPEGAEEGEEEHEQREGEEEGEEKPQEEPEEPDLPQVPLTFEMVKESLSLLCKIGDGLAHAYVKLEASEKEVTHVDILKAYIHLRYVNLSKNMIRDVSCLQALTHLLVLRCDQNALRAVKLTDPLPYLQIVSCNNNLITELSGFNHPLLEHLSVNNNNIRLYRGLESRVLTRLHTLELRGNKLETTDGIYLPNLRNLFLAQNRIVRLEGITRLTNLATLHLRDNALESFDGFSEELKNLEYLNMRGNKCSNMKEVQKLKVLPALKALVLAENPISEEEDYRMECLVASRKLLRLDKTEYAEEEREEAQQIFEQRRQEDLAALAAAAAAAAEMQAAEGENMAAEEAE